MITGFKRLTEELNDYERTELLPMMVRCLKRHVGKENVITNAEMCARMGEHGYKIGAARLRKIVNNIRVNGLVPCLVATGNGYYVSTDVDEVIDYIDSLMGRIAAITAVKDALVKQVEDLMKKE